MKPNAAILKLFYTLCCVCPAAGAFGQATEIWTGGGDGTNVAVAANWGGTLPSTANNDTAEWNGTVPGNLLLHYNSPNQNWQSGPGQDGVNLYLAAAQSGSVQIVNDVGGSAYLAITDITLDAGAGSFLLGETNTANILWVIGRPNGSTHNYINNSTSPAIINPRVRFAGGGGAAWTFDFQGTGNWYCTNQLCNDNGPGMNIQVDGPGTLFWNASDAREFQAADGIATPVVINAGTLVLTGQNPKLNSQNFTLDGSFEFNAPSEAQTLTGVFSGSGTNIVAGGTLTLTGQNTYSGDTVLSGGELMVNGAETPGTSGPLGIGQIDFNGGTLGYGVNNSFDYSSRFSTAANQAYSIDTGIYAVALGSGLTSSGGSLTKFGSGTLTLTGTNTYTGITTVTAGTLMFQGPKSGAANIVVQDTATLGIVENGSPITPGTLAVGTSAGATLQFDNLTNQTTAPLQAGTISAIGPITVTVGNGSFNTIGQAFPLFSWSSGSAPAVVNPPIVSGAAGTLSTNGNTIVLTITSTPYVWTGAQNATWDHTSVDWVQSGTALAFTDGALALFNDNVSGATNVTISGVVQPASVTFSDNSLNYSILSSAGNEIGGASALTKNNDGILTLSGGANTFTGIMTINGGTVSVGTLANGGSASDIGAAGNVAANLVLNGGTLQYTGAGAAIDHLFALGSKGGTIDASGAGTLSLTNAGTVGLIGNGAHSLTLMGTNAAENTFAANLANSSGGATALVKAGSGTWVLTGTNTYTGLTTVNSGVLQIGAGGASGTLGGGNVLNNAGLDFDFIATQTVSSVISGTGSVTNDGPGTLILTGNDSYTGGTAVNAGTLQVGAGGTGGTLYPNASIILGTNATFIFDSKTHLTISGYLTGIQGSGNVIVRSGCFLTSIDDNNYTGWTEIDSGATFQPTYGNDGVGLNSSVVTNNGTFYFLRQDNFTFGYSNSIVGTGKVVKENDNANFGDITLSGTNTYTGGTWLQGGGLILGDGITPGAGSIIGPVIFTNTTTAFLNARWLTFDRVDNFTFTNDIIAAVTDGSATANSGSVGTVGPDIVTLTGNDAYPGGVFVGTGTLQIGDGGTTGGPSTVSEAEITNNGVLVFDRSDNIEVSGAVSDGASAGNGQGSIVQQGTGTLTLAGATTNIAGTITVSNGTLVISGLVGPGTNAVGGNLSVNGGTLQWGGASDVNILNVQGNMVISSGSIVVNLNKSLSVSNSFILMTNYVNLSAGTITASGGTLKLVNVGPALAAGDRFTLFSQPLPAQSASALTITGAGATWRNDLAVNGSITALSVTSLVNTHPPVVQVSLSGNNLNLGWPTNQGWTLQTNSVGLNASNQWFSYPGSTTLTNVIIPVLPGAPNVFFRMVYTNTP